MESRLAAGGGAALHGPSGIGKTAVLDAVAAAAVARGELVPRLRPTQTERRLPYAGIADLVAQLPPDAAGTLPPAQRAALAALRQGLPPRAGTPALARRLVLPLLLAQCARRRPVLLVIDDVQWLDAESAELIGFAMRRRPGPRVRVVAAQRWPDPAGRRRAARLCPAPVTELDVPPLEADELTALLESRGLPCRTASRLHAASGGTRSSRSRSAALSRRCPAAAPAAAARARAAGCCASGSGRCRPASPTRCWWSRLATTRPRPC